MSHRSALDRALTGAYNYRMNPTEIARSNAYCAIEALIEEARDDLDGMPVDIDAYRDELVNLLRILDNLDDE